MKQSKGKKGRKSEERILNAIEASNLLDIEFKIMIIRMFKELSENYKELYRSYKELRVVRSNAGLPRTEKNLK